MSDELEKALGRALRPRDPGDDFAARVVARLDASGSPPAAGPAPGEEFEHRDEFQHRLEFQRRDESRRNAESDRRGEFTRRRAFCSRWLPAALAACLIAGLGLIGLRQHAIEVARADQARSQLLQALSIASRNVNIVRAAVSREENPDS